VDGHRGKVEGVNRIVIGVTVGAILLACAAPTEGGKEEPPPAAEECTVPPAPVIPGQNTITVIACTTPPGHRAHMALDGFLADGRRFPDDEGLGTLPIDVVDATPFAKVLHYPKGELATVTFSVYTVQEKTGEIYCKILDNNQSVPQADSPRVKVSGPNSRAVCMLTTSGR
jgi:hypothetical protein